MLLYSNYRYKADNLYLLIRFLLGLFVNVHVSFQVDCIDELLGTQIACNH